jgi:hypothetical protein
MKKSDINSSMLFKMGNGDRCVLLQKTNINEDTKKIEHEDIFYDQSDIENGKKYGISNLENYNEDLELVGFYDNSYNIVAIKQYYSIPQALLALSMKDYNHFWDWERKETKEMTIEEIEKELGYSIKIINK